MRAYRGAFSIFGRYWSAYGGAKALLGSIYLHAAIAMLLVTVHTWFAPVCDKDGACTGWWEQSLSVLPNLLGFTLGGFAIFTGFGDDRFRALLATPNEDPSKPTVYVEVCSAFVHFIVVQVLALLSAVIAKSWVFYAPWMDPVRAWLPLLNFVGGFLGYGLFLYAITSVLAATMQVFRISNAYSKHQALLTKHQASQGCGPGRNNHP
jgi:hypothetical protein